MTKENFEKIEKALIGVSIIIPLLAAFLFQENEQVILRWSTLSVVGLALFYLNVFSKNKIAALILVLVVGIVLDVFLDQQEEHTSYQHLTRAVVGLYFTVLTVQSMVKTKSFELLYLLMGVFLMANFLLFLQIPIFKDLHLLVVYGSAFSLMTIIYFENLWSTLESIHQKTIIVLLLSILSEVILQAKTLLN